jgi:hypothetical protein
MILREGKDVESHREVGHGDKSVIYPVRRSSTLFWVAFSFLILVFRKKTPTYVEADFYCSRPCLLFPWDGICLNKKEEEEEVSFGSLH